MSEDLSAFYEINITAQTDTQTRQGFGTPLFAVSRVPWVGGARVRAFASLPEMVNAGFKARDPAYQMAQAAFSQEPRPAVVKIGQRARPPTQVVRVMLGQPSPNDAPNTYRVKIDGLAVQFTTDATPDRDAEAVPGLVNAINAAFGADDDAIVLQRAVNAAAPTVVSGGALNGALVASLATVPRRLSITLNNDADWTTGPIVVMGLDPEGVPITENFVVPAGGNTTLNGTKHFRAVTQVTVPTQAGTNATFRVGVRASITAVADGDGAMCTSAEAGVIHSYELTALVPEAENVFLEDRTGDPGIAADLNELLASDADFYGLALDSNGMNEVLAAAAWCEPRRRLFVFQTADGLCGVAETNDDVLSRARNAGYGYTTGWFHAAIGRSDGWLAAALLGNRLPRDPGSDTWAYKTLRGITPLAIATSAREAILAKNGNVYETRSGVGVTFEGKVAMGEWIDTVRGLDWQRARMREELFRLLRANEKVGFTDDGIALIGAAIFGVLDEGVERQFYAKDPKPKVTTLLAAQTSPADRSARRLRGVTFSAQLAGAIHGVTVNGTAAV